MAHHFPFSFSSIPAGSRMGILNITPDSFSDAGRDLFAEAALGHARELVAAGARALDLGGEASSFFRKNIQPVEADEQLRRLLPIVSALREALPQIPLSIDTRSAAVAEACLARGASIINDISAGTHDPAMLETVGRHRAAVILMHITPGYPQTGADDPRLVENVREYLAERIAAARGAGITEIAVDSGIGFGKSMQDNWRLVTQLEAVGPRGMPMVLGISRKRFLETPPPPEIAANLRTVAARFPAEEHPRDAMTAAVTEFVGPRASLHRVHTILHTSQSVRTC